MRRRWGKRVMWGIAPLAILALAAFGFVVMYLWNWLVPSLFGGHAIGYWQAWGIIVLSKILFGGFSGHQGHGGNWKHRMKERCDRMTPEERQKFLQSLSGRGEPTAPEPAS